ncbi:sigma factor-like helix-turn-helix DNA-binding protein [Luedemannella flava]
MALTLRVLGGLSTAEIARGFLTSEPTVAQRIVRPSGRSRTSGSRSRCPSRPSGPPGWRPSWRCST